MRTATFFLLVVSCRGFQTSSKFAHIIAQASTSRAETPSLQVLGAGRGEGNADRDFGQKTIPRGKGAINFIQACEAYQEELLDGQAAAAQSIVRASTVAVGAKAQKAKTAPSRARVLEMASAGRQESYAPSSAGSWGARSVDKVFKSGTSLPVCEDVRAARASDTLKHERNALLEEQRLQQQKLQLQQQLLQQEQQQQLQQQQQLLQQRQQLQQQQQQKQLQIQLQQVQQQKQQRKDVAPPPDQRRRGGAPAMGYMPVQYLKMTREDDKVRIPLSLSLESRALFLSERLVQYALLFITHI
jgi:flagellar biosynthesis GTPase FlhF